MRKDIGELPATYDVWLETHTKKDGTAIDEVVATAKVCTYSYKGNHTDTLHYATHYSSVIKLTIVSDGLVGSNCHSLTKTNN